MYPLHVNCCCSKKHGTAARENVDDIAFIELLRLHNLNPD